MSGRLQVQLYSQYLAVIRVVVAVVVTVVVAVVVAVVVVVGMRWRWR